MIKNRIIILMVCLSLLLSACGSNTPTPFTQATIDAIKTSVVQTLAVSMPTMAATPTLTPSPTLDLTPISTPTIMLPTPSATATVPLCDNSVFVDDITIEDNTVMTPGQVFTKTWSIKNTGTCTWGNAYKVAFLSGTAMGGTATALTTAITPGHADNVSVTLVAPTVKGTYTGYWIMQNAAGTAFGAKFYVTIVVSTTLTATPTGTITPTPDLLATAVASALAGTATANAAAAQTATALASITPVP